MINEKNEKKVVPCESRAKKANKDSLVSVFSPLNMEYLFEHEATSLYILMQHISRIQNIPMKLMRTMLELELGVDDIHELPRASFENAIRFLSDLYDESGTHTPRMRN